MKAARLNRDILPLFEHMAKRAFEDEDSLVFLDDCALAEDLGLNAEQLGQQLGRLERVQGSTFDRPSTTLRCPCG